MLSHRTKLVQNENIIYHCFEVAGGLMLSILQANPQ
jgi:hypothetical protein